MNIAFLLIGLGLGVFIGGMIYLYVIHQVGKSAVIDRHRSMDQLDELNKMRAHSNVYQASIAASLKEIAKSMKGDK